MVRQRRSDQPARLGMMAPQAVIGKAFSQALAAPNRPWPAAFALHHPFGCPCAPAHEKMRVFESQNNRKHAMEAERTNTIRHSLADLTARVAELRRYL
jgi:hypothetical protein